MDYKKEYNEMMMDLCLEHLTIGTKYSEDTDGWNLRDMVSECQYQLDLHYEEGNANSDGISVEHFYDTYGGDEEQAKECHKQWLHETRKLRGFINRHKNEAMKLKCSIGHCSKFD